MPADRRRVTTYFNNVLWAAMLLNGGLYLLKYVSSDANVHLDKAKPHGCIVLIGFSNVAQSITRII